MLRGFSTAVVAALVAVGCGASPLVGGTGGSPGYGGAPCTVENGCLRGSGGVSGTAGAGLTGSGGINGAGGGSALCNELTAEYAQATTAALACTPGAPNQCQVLVEIQPSACPDCGQMFVNDGTNVQAVGAKWIAACGPVPAGSCPSYSCASPAPVTCVPTSPGATTGTCVKYGSDAGAELAPDGGESCDQLAADYQAAVTAAQACTPGVPNQCQTDVYPLPKGPQGCPFPTAINDPTQVNAIWQKWANQCDPSTAILLIKCDDPGPAVCVGNFDGGVVSTKAGTCQVLSGAE
ncbi:MAG TPA: hypothetical protein VKZ18_13000 [Polyangia bacterium]|nr:hypothetical protein [Polyangia bacterium]